VGWNFALTEGWVFPGRPGRWTARLPVAVPRWVRARPWQAMTLPRPHLG